MLGATCLPFYRHLSGARLTGPRDKDVPQRAHKLPLLLTPLRLSLRGRKMRVRGHRLDPQKFCCGAWGGRKEPVCPTSACLWFSAELTCQTKDPNTDPCAGPRELNPRPHGTGSLGCPREPGRKHAGFDGSFPNCSPVGRAPLTPCEGSGRCVVSFDFKRRNISAGRNRKIITLGSRGSYATKKKCAGSPSPPVKYLWALSRGLRLLPK